MTAQDHPIKVSGWFLLVYRVPSEPSNNRVSVWRELKRIGALYLQQCVCILPKRRKLRADLVKIREKISKLDGSSNLFEISRLSPQEEEALVEGFRDLAFQHYSEIVEECDTKFVKEIEFERFRKNYTFAEAEEISSDLDKIRGWFKRVQDVDWFGGKGRLEVEERIQKCARLLDEFYAEVHARSSVHLGGPDNVELGHEAPRLELLPPATDPEKAPDLTGVLSHSVKIRRKRSAQ